jgi:hypothetical protein
MVMPLIWIWFADSLAGVSVVGGRGPMRFPSNPRHVALCGWALLVGLPGLFILIRLVS